MPQVFILKTTSSPWTVPSDFIATGHTVELLAAGGQGGVGTTGTSGNGGGGAGGGGYGKLTYSSGTITPGTTTIAFQCSGQGDPTTAGALWEATNTGFADFYGTLNGGSPGTSTTGGAAGVAGSQTGTPAILYTVTTSTTGGAGGSTGTTLGGSGGGGSAGPAANGGAGGGNTSTGTGGGGGGGGGAANGGFSTAISSGADGGVGSSGKQGVGGGGATGGAATGSSGGGGGDAVSTAVTATGGAGSGGTDFDGSHGCGGGGGGCGANTGNVAAVQNGGAAGAYGGGGGGTGYARGSATFTGGLGGDGLIVVTYPIPTIPDQYLYSGRSLRSLRGPHQRTHSASLASPLPVVTAPTGNTPPTLISTTATAIVTAVSVTTASIAVQNGDVLLGFYATEHANTGFSFPGSIATASGSTSAWTSRIQLPTANDLNRSYIRVWSATATATGNITVTFSAGTGGDHIKGWVQVWRGSTGIGATSTNDNSTGSGSPTVSVTTQQADSALAYIDGDWNAVTGTATFTSSAGTAVQDVSDQTATGSYCCYGSHLNDAGTVGSKTMGMSSPSTQRYVNGVIEVKGTTGAAVTPTGSTLAMMGVG
jgi:hypothetical protein